MSNPSLSPSPVLELRQEGAVDFCENNQLINQPTNNAPTPVSSTKTKGRQAGRPCGGWKKCAFGKRPSRSDSDNKPRVHTRYPFTSPSAPSRCVHSPPPCPPRVCARAWTRETGYRAGGPMTRSVVFAHSNRRETPLDNRNRNKHAEADED